MALTAVLAASALLVVPSSGSSHSNTTLQPRAAVAPGVQIDQGDSIRPGQSVQLPCVLPWERGGSEVPNEGDYRVSGYVDTSLTGPGGVLVPGVAQNGCQPRSFKVTEPGDYELITVAIQSSERWECFYEELPDDCYPEGSPYPQGKWARDPDHTYTTSLVAKFKVEGKYEWFTKGQRERFAESAENLDAVMAAEAACTLGPPPFPAVCGGGAVLTALEKFALGKLAKDPPDDSFRKLARARRLTPPPVPTGDGVSPAGAAALDELFASQAGAVANLQALLTSVERAGGARLARSKVWERRQLAAADRFASAAADHLERELRLRESARTELERGGLQSRVVTGADAYASEEQLGRGNPPLEEEELGSRDGTPEPFTSVFDQLKTPLAARVHFRASALFVAPPESPESVIGQYPADLTAPAVLDAVRKAAAALRSFARGI